MKQLLNTISLMLYNSKYLLRIVIEYKPNLIYLVTKYILTNILLYIVHTNNIIKVI